MIDYSLALRASNPSEKDSAKKVFGNAQQREVLTLADFARHISQHGSVYDRSTIVGCITAVVDCLREELLNGNAVSLGELGKFYVTLSTEGVEDATEFNPNTHVTSVNVRWDKGSNFSNLKDDASFRLVSTRKEQAAALKAEKQGLNEVISNGGTSGGNSGGNQGGSGTGDPGDVTP